MIEIRHPADLNLETIEDIAFGNQPLRLHPELLGELRRSHEEMVAALSGGQRVYGVNTGMGYLAGTDLRGVELERHQRNLLLGRAVGSPPYLPAEEVRALMAVRLINLVSGYAGATPELCRFLVDRLNDGFIPAVPRGGVGSAGEVIPLSHAFQTFLGVGYVLEPDGSVKDAALALAEARRRCPTNLRRRKASHSWPGVRGQSRSPSHGGAPLRFSPASCSRARPAR